MSIITFKVKHMEYKKNKYNGKKIFKIVNSSQSEHDDDKLSQIYQPSHNNKIPNSSKIPMTIDENTRAETNFNSIWNKFEYKYNQKDAILFLKNKVFGYIVIYINRLLHLLGIKEKFFPVYKDIIYNIDILFNNTLLISTLEDIISGNIIIKNKENEGHNIKLIKYLYDNKCYIALNCLKLTFFDCLSHLRQTKFSHLLIGFEAYYKEIMKEIEEKEGKEYLEYFTKILYDYEYIFRNYFRTENVKIVPIKD